MLELIENISDQSTRFSYMTELTTPEWISYNPGLSLAGPISLIKSAVGVFPVQLSRSDFNRCRCYLNREKIFRYFAY